MGKPLFITDLGLFDHSYFPQTVTRLAYISHNTLDEQPGHLGGCGQWSMENKDFLQFNHKATQNGDNLTVHTTINPHFTLHINYSRRESPLPRDFGAYMGPDMGRALLSRFASNPTLIPHVTLPSAPPNGLTEKDTSTQADYRSTLNEKAACSSSAVDASETSMDPSPPLPYKNLQDQLEGYLYEAFKSALDEGYFGSLKSCTSDTICKMHPITSVSLHDVPIIPSWGAYTVSNDFQGLFTKPKALTWTVSLDGEWREPKT